MSRLISNYTLPSKEGYVEVENELGERIYEITPEQQKKEEQEQLLLDLQAENADLKATIDALLGVTEEVTP